MIPPAFTIIGGAGFAGSNLISYLQGRGEQCYAPGRLDEQALFDRPLSNVIYCAGVTSDFRKRTYDTVEAHVSLLNRLLKYASFESFLYLSSTRVYIHTDVTEEEAPLVVAPMVPEDLFNLSKLLGESICLNSERDNVRIARLSNVLGEDRGSDNFVFSLIREARSTGRITLQTTLDSGKDYIHIQDVVELLHKISLGGKQSVYNLASGSNLSNGDVVAAISQSIDVDVSISDAARKILFKPIDTSRIKAEFGYQPRSVNTLISKLSLLDF